MSEDKKVTPKVSWISTEYSREPWQRVEYGQVIAPPNQQKSNLPLTAKDVLQERAQPIGDSAAFPIMPSIERTTGGVSAPSDGSGHGII